MIFTASVVASLFDPISLIGYALAGALIRNYWGAVAIGMAWRLLLQLVIVVPAARGSSLPAYMLEAALVGAFIATSLVYLVARAIRTNREDPAQAQKETTQKTQGDRTK